MNRFLFLEEFHEHDLGLDQSLLILVYRPIWEFKPRGMKNGPLIFPIVTHQGVGLDHYLEVGSLLKDFSSILSWSDLEGLRRSMVDIDN